MRIKRLAALSQAAVLTAAMLTGCPWDIEDDASSVTSSPSSSSSISRPSYDDDDDEDDNSADEESSSSSSSSEPENPAPDPAKPETWQVSEDGSTLIVPSGATSEQITKDLFKTHPNITSLDLRGSGVTTIGDGAFDYCTNLQRVTMGNMTIIDEEAFSQCTNLEIVTMGNVDSIGESAFEYCTVLKTVTMGDVDRIEEDAFVGCTALETVTMGNVGTISDDAFNGFQNLQTVSMGTVQTIGDSAFSGCAKLAHIRFEINTASAVEEDAFVGAGHDVNTITVYSDWAKQNQDTVKDWFNASLYVNINGCNENWPFPPTEGAGVEAYKALRRLLG